MNNLFKQHYNAIEKRGKITPETTIDDFIMKMYEEIDELSDYTGIGCKELSSDAVMEVIDVMAVCGNLLQHMGYDVEVEFKKNIEKQLNRTD